MNSRVKVLRAFAIILIVTVPFLPIISNNLPRFIVSFKMVWGPLWITMIIICTPKILLNKLAFYITFYGFVFIMILLKSEYSVFTNWDVNRINDEFYDYVVAISVLLYFKISKDYEGLALVTKWAMIFIFVTSILSIITSIYNPLYAREIIGLSTVHNQYERDRILSFERFGGGTYGFAGALLCLFPIIVYYYRNNKEICFSKTQLLLFGIIIFIALIRMQIFANIILAIGTTIFALLGSKNIFKSFLFLFFVAVIIMYVPLTFYADLLIYLSKYADPNSDIYYKLNDLAKFVISGNLETTGTGERASRFPLLIKEFLSNPLWGSYFSNDVPNLGGGGHLYWLYKLTILGCFGFIPFIIIHIYFIKISLKDFNNNYSFYFLTAVFTLFALGVIKNLSGREMWFTYFVLLPGLFYLPKLNKVKKSCEKIV